MIMRTTQKSQKSAPGANYPSFFSSTALLFVHGVCRVHGGNSTIQQGNGNHEKLNHAKTEGHVPICADTPLDCTVVLTFCYPNDDGQSQNSLMGCFQTCTFLGKQIFV